MPSHESEREVQIIESSNPSPTIESVWRVVSLAEDGSHWVDHGTYLERDEAEAVKASLS